MLRYSIFRDDLVPALHGMLDLDLDLQGLGGLAPLGNLQGMH